MSASSKRFLKKLISYSSLVFFALAVGMLWWQLRQHSFMDIVHAFFSIPLENVALAMFACVLGYTALAFYDFLALKYVGQAHKVSWWKWMLAGIIGFAISNNAGTAVVTGGAVRYRLYTRWRIKGGDIVKMLTFIGFTYFLGAAAIMTLGYFIVPRALFAESAIMGVGISALFLFCVAALGAYYAGTLLFQGKQVKVAGLDFKIPNVRMAFAQMTTGMLDSILAGTILYFLVIPFVDISFTTFIAVFVIAQVAGVFSQVPGGVGVFESIIMVAMPGVTNYAALFGALMAFRIIYYVLPLIVAGGMFMLYENSLRAKLKKWRDEAIAEKLLEQARERADAARARIESMREQAREMRDKVKDKVRDKVAKLRK